MGCLSLRPRARHRLRGELPADCKTLIRSTLLPKTRGHIPVLDRLMSAK
jgi:hypothetical protein